MCVAFALGREATPFRSRGVFTRRHADAPCRADERVINGRRMLILETGVGERAVTVAGAWLHSQSVNGVISAGYCGALSPELSVGDVVQARELLAPDGTIWPLEVIPTLSGRTVLRAIGATKLIGTKHAKQQLHTQTGAAIVDMESAAWARHCADAGIPFSIVRVVSDSAADELSPRLLGLLAQGKVRPMRVMAALLRSPGLIREFLRLAGRTRRAAINLADALQQIPAS